MTTLRGVLLVGVALLALGLPARAQDAKTPTEICAAAVPAKNPTVRQFPKAEQVLQPGVDYHAVFCTDVGAVYFDLFEDITPVTVNSFVFLAQQGFYNTTTFHRVIASFMAQGGDPTGTGTGSPGYQFKDEFTGFLTFDVPGWLAMANSGPNTNGSQFFITTAPTEHLNFKHTIFGEVLEDQKTVEAIRLRDPNTDTAPGTALQTVVIITDPASVKTTYTPPPLASQDEVEAAMDSIQKQIPPDSGVILDSQATGTVTTEAVLDGMPEALREDFGQFMKDHQHQYRVSSTLVNAKCDLGNVFYTSLRYTIDVFDSRDAAAAVLNDPFFADLPLKTGFTETIASQNLRYPMYGVKEKACEVEVVHAITHWQRGRFVVTSEASIPSVSENLPYLDMILSDFVGGRIYEVLLKAVLRKEIGKV